MPEFRLLKDLPNLVRNYPVAIRASVRASHIETLLLWRDRKEFPGLAYRFTWRASAISQGYGFSMRKAKYGSPTALRVNYARQGLGMPREAMPGAGGRFVSRGARRAPNLDKPWNVESGGTMNRLLARRPKSTFTGSTVSTRLNPSGFGINLLGARQMHGILTASWVKVPVTYPMKVYKDAVNRAGGYTVQVTRRIGRWVHTTANRTYRQEFEDLTHDLPWIHAQLTVIMRRRLSSLVFDSKGRVRPRFIPGNGRVRMGEVLSVLTPAELAVLRGA